MCLEIRMNDSSRLIVSNPAIIDFGGEKLDVSSIIVLRFDRYPMVYCHNYSIKNNRMLYCLINDTNQLRSHISARAAFGIPLYRKMLTLASMRKPYETQT
jgi:hypothetical protein